MASGNDVAFVVGAAAVENATTQPDASNGITPGLLTDQHRAHGGDGQNGGTLDGSWPSSDTAGGMQIDNSVAPPYHPYSNTSLIGFPPGVYNGSILNNAGPSGAFGGVNDDATRIQDNMAPATNFVQYQASPAEGLIFGMSNEAGPSRTFVGVGNVQSQSYNSFAPDPRFAPYPASFTSGFPEYMSSEAGPPNGSAGESNDDASSGQNTRFLTEGMASESAETNMEGPSVLIACSKHRGDQVRHRPVGKAGH